MTGPADQFDRALAAAFEPGAGLRARPDAGARLRRRAARRRAAQAVAGATGSLALIAVAVLVVGPVLVASPVLGREAGSPPPAAAASGVAAVQMRDEPPPRPWKPGPAARFDWSYGQSRLDNPLEVVPVRRLDTSQCVAALAEPNDSGLASLDERCYHLDRPPVLVVSYLLSVEVTRTAPSGAAGVSLWLAEPNSTVLRTYTSAHVGSPVAFVVAGQVRWVAQIRHPLDGRVLEIVTDRSTEDAIRLVGSLGLRLVVDSRLATAGLLPMAR
jgi:hypothetical protein